MSSMRFTGLARCGVIWALWNIPIVRSQDAAICEGELNADTWNAAGMADIMNNQVVRDQASEISRIGYQAILKASIAGEVADQYVCDARNACDLTLLNNNCPVNPGAATILKAMANWCNFWRDVTTNIVESLDFVASQSDLLRQSLNPEVLSPDRDLTPGQTPLLAVPGPGTGRADQTEFGGIAAMIVTAMLTLNYDPIGQVRFQERPFRDFRPFVEKLMFTIDRAGSSNGRTGGYDGYEDISASISALKRTIQDGIGIYVDEELNSRDIFVGGSTDRNLIFQLEEGDFAAPIPPPTSRAQIIMSAAAPAINRLWNDRQVVGLRITQKDATGKAIFEGIDGGLPLCDNIARYPQGAVCNFDGSLVLLRQIPGDLLALQNAVSTNLVVDEAYQAPGLDILGNFEMPSIDIIISAALDNQALKGYLAPPTDRLDPVEVDLRSIMFANFPVCNFDQVTVSDELLAAKCSIPGDFAESCITHVYLLCGCPDQVVGESAWPYRTADTAPQCRL